MPLPGCSQGTLPTSTRLDSGPCRGSRARRPRAARDALGTTQDGPRPAQVRPGGGTPAAPPASAGTGASLGVSFQQPLGRRWQARPTLEQSPLGPLLPPSPAGLYPGKLRGRGRRPSPSVSPLPRSLNNSHQLSIWCLDRPHPHPDGTELSQQRTLCGALLLVPFWGAGGTSGQGAPLQTHGGHSDTPGRRGPGRGEQPDTRAGGQQPPPSKAPQAAGGHRGPQTGHFGVTGREVSDRQTDGLSSSGSRTSNQPHCCVVHHRKDSVSGPRGRPPWHAATSPAPGRPRPDPVCAVRPSHLSSRTGLGTA